MATALVGDNEAVTAAAAVTVAAVLAVAAVTVGSVFAVAVLAVAASLLLKHAASTPSPVPIPSVDTFLFWHERTHG